LTTMIVEMVGLEEMKNQYETMQILLKYGKPNKELSED
jgi:hypothetical protein